VSYLLDTSVLSELRKGARCNPTVANWARAQTVAALFTSVLVLGEVRKGIELRRRRDPDQADALDRWLASIHRAFAGRVLPVDAAVAERWGRMNATGPPPSVDGLLAATAAVHDLTLVTRDRAIRPGAGVRVFDPFGEP